jgi:hypothetical protein
MLYLGGEADQVTNDNGRVALCVVPLLSAGVVAQPSWDYALFHLCKSNPWFYEISWLT